jgi:hypothetical protein
MSLTDSHVTISLGDLDALRAEVKAAEDRARDLEEQLADAKLGPDPEFARHTIEAFRATLPIIQFAVGNLHPSAVRSWPYEALRNVAEYLKTLPGADVNDHALAHEFVEVAKQAQGYEEFRRVRDAQTVVLPASPADWGPQTEEAKAVHDAFVLREAKKDKSD